MWSEGRVVLERLSDLVAHEMGRLRSAGYDAGRKRRPVPLRLQGVGAGGEGSCSESKDVCALCRGVGYLRQDVEVGDPRFGKPVPCACKREEWQERKRRSLQEVSQLDALSGKCFDGFNAHLQGVREAFVVAQEYAAQPDGWLLLLGRSGCGKTHLAAAIAHRLLERELGVLFITTADLLDHLRATFAPDSAVLYDQLFADVRGVELLVLDDLGAENQTPWAAEKLFQVLNHRYNARALTVITANSGGLQSVDERLRSRLADVGLVQCVAFDRAQDYRARLRRRQG